MKSRYLDKEIKELERLRKEGKISYIGGERLSRYNEIRRELESIDSWINVEDRLPEEGKVLVMVKKPSQMNLSIDIAMRYKHKLACKDRRLDNNFIIHGTVTHWQPLPNPPTK